MEATDVPCPYCQVGIGEPCRNPQGGPLGYNGSRQKSCKHIDRWDELTKVVSAWEASGQGMLRVLLRGEQEAIDKLTSMQRPIMARDGADLSRLIQSRHNRYSALWNLLSKENRPAVGRYKKVVKVDIPHPLLIDCPVPECGKKKGEPCHQRSDTQDPKDLTAYHLLRVRQSP